MLSLKGEVTPSIVVCIAEIEGIEHLKAVILIMCVYAVVMTSNQKERQNGVVVCVRVGERNSNKPLRVTTNILSVKKGIL
jgi:hypothetical protein